MKQYKVGIVGCGAILPRHLEAIEVNSNFKLVAVCDIQKDLVKSIAKKLKVKAYTDFKAGKHRVLISSNVTSRGIDVQQVRTVLNFDLPKCIFNYLHRIGRSGRWGRKGTAINFVTRWDIKTMKDIERHYHTIVEELPSNITID